MPIRLTKANNRKIEEYANRSGKTTATVINEAISIWFDLYGEIALEELDRGVPPGKRLIDHPLFS
jgi:predicted DNA-binding protein